jgi:hypothetical protein
LFGEGQLTILKGKIVSNLNLYYCGKMKNIPGRMNVDDFSPTSNFIVPAYTVHCQLKQELNDAQVNSIILCQIILYHKFYWESK